MINGSQTDGRACNDNITKRYQVVNGNSGSKHVLIEEFTGAWCGYCPDGALRLEQIIAATPNTIGVSVHDNDQMAFTDNIRTFFSVTSYPSGSVDRFHFKEQNEAKIPVTF